MPYGSQAIDAGTNPTIPVAVDEVGGARFQRVKLAHPTADQVGAFGVDASPVRTANRDRGTADYDSGLLTVPDSLTPLTAQTVYVKAFYFHNRSTTEVRRVVVEDSNGVQIIACTLEPEGWVNVPRYGARSDGLSWSCSAPNAVTGQVHGWQ